MKRIPLLTIMLWLLIILGFKFIPAYFLNEYIQYPLIIIISILLPVSFWLKIKEKRKFFSLLYIAIFLVNIGFLFFAIERSYSTQKSLGNSSNRGIVPEIAEVLSESENAERRKSAAKHIYQHHAIRVPYKLSDDNYALYSPTEADKASYQETSAKKARLDRIMMDSTVQMLSACFFLILHVGIFIGLLIFLNFYEE